jgi:hypothetical protein
VLVPVKHAVAAVPVGKPLPVPSNLSLLPSRPSSTPFLWSSHTTSPTKQLAARTAKLLWLCCKLLPASANLTSVQL